MATYTKSKGGSVGAGQDKTYEFDAITIPDSQQFKRCKVEKASSYLSYCELRGNAQDVFGRNGFDSWSTNKTGVNWSKSGDAPKVKVHNTDSTTHAWTLKVTIETEAKPTYGITISSGTGGTVTANRSTAYSGQTVTLTVTPSTNYRLNTLTVKKGSTTITVTNNQFTMPAGAVTVTATWTQTTFAITKKANPTGAGTVSGASSAVPGTSVTVTQTPAAGYYFTGWTISSGSISSGGTFTMPSSAVTVTANYLRGSTGTLNKTDLTGGEDVTLTINAGSPEYSHTYELDFGTGMSMQQTVAAGERTVTFTVPLSWSQAIPNAEGKTGGTLTLRTYSGETQIGSYTISGLTYAVPADVIPTVEDFLPEVVRTIDGTTYANVGDVFTQNHCGVSVETEAAGAQGSTIHTITLTMSNYSGAEYSMTVTDPSPAEIQFTSGLLTIAGVTEITVEATDSRGRKGRATAEITVAAYSNPTGTLAVYRADQNGDVDDVGSYGIYTLTSAFTAVGTNGWTVRKITSQGADSTGSLPSSGFLLPGAAQTFTPQDAFTITLTLRDEFEQTVVTAQLPSAKFILYVDAGGDRIGIMKVADKTIPQGKDSTFEISGDTQVYIGSETLEEFIRRIAGS